MKNIKIEISLRDAKEAQSRLSDTKHFPGVLKQEYTNSYTMKIYGEDEEDEEELLNQAVNDLQTTLKGLEFEIIN